LTLKSEDSHKKTTRILYTTLHVNLLVN